MLSFERRLRWRVVLIATGRLARIAASARYIERFGMDSWSVAFCICGGCAHFDAGLVTGDSIGVS